MELQHELTLAKEFKDLAEDFRISSILELCHNNERYAEIDIKCKVYYQEMSEHFFKQAADTLASYFLNDNLEVYLEPSDQIGEQFSYIANLYVHRLKWLNDAIAEDYDKVIISLCNNDMAAYYSLVQIRDTLKDLKERAYHRLKVTLLRMLKHNNITVNGE